MLLEGQWGPSGSESVIVAWFVLVVALVGVGKEDQPSLCIFHHFSMVCYEFGFLSKVSCMS